MRYDGIMPDAVSKVFAIGMMLVAATAVVASVLAFVQGRRARALAAVRARVTVKVALVFGIVTGAVALFGHIVLSNTTHFAVWLHRAGVGALVAAIPLSVVSMAVNLTVMLRLLQFENATRREWMMVACGSALCIVPFAILLPNVL